jgi:PIN like domain
MYAPPRSAWSHPLGRAIGIGNSFPAKGHRATLQGVTEDAASESDRSDDRPSESVGENASDAEGIFVGRFDVYRTVTEDDYRAVLTSGLVVLDTSALLNLYRYHAKTREELVQVLRRLRGRVWVPDHAMYEFFEGRLGVIDNRAKELRQAIDRLNGYGAELEQVIRTWANRVSLPQEQTAELIEAGLQPASTSIASLVDKIREISVDNAFEHADDTAKDPVIAALNEILVNGVGEPLPDDELQEVKKAARKRSDDKIPPGWKDADKSENPEGDYLIWYQTLQEAKRRGTDVLFVTGDVKEDWWRRERGELKGPLPALMQELRAIAGVRLYMLRPASLLAHAGAALGIEVSSESVKDAERVSTQAAVSWDLLPKAAELRLRLFASRWRYTPNGFDIGTLANLSQRSFSHPSYMVEYEKKRPAVRVGAFVACEALSSGALTAEYLRSQMREILSQPTMMAFVAKLTHLPVGAQWQSQPGRGRLTLEADLMSSLAPDTPFASALLLMPDSEIRRYGTDPSGAELYLHIDLPMTENADSSASQERVGLTEWHERFTSALGVPDILARFLEGIGLTVLDEPEAKFAVQIQGRVVNQLGIEEVVDFDNFEALTPRKHSVQFDGWAVADPAGKLAGALAKRLLTDLCESVGRTGYDTILAGLPD